MSDVVLDNSVLSSFYTAGWFGSLERLSEDHNLIASSAIWREFENGCEIGSPPNWLTVDEVDRLPFIENIGKLSTQDLTCIALGETNSAMVVANDRKLKETAEDRGLRVVWGTKFMLDIFRSCTISKSELDGGKQSYIEDLYLNERVENEIRQAEKP